ncbi:hypothetical protein [Maricaulis sp. MIT060901]|uniref:hypothetical protein n=1 Tax=Maricaulis sp. MIT060901 TaxID=3096993 RepID=UPI00399A4F48
MKFALLALALTNQPVAETVSGNEPEFPITVPSEMCRGYFFVPVTLRPGEDGAEDRTLWFIYDTGASTTYVDPDSVARISSTRVREGQRANFPEMSMGPLRVTSLRARVQDLDHLSLALGREVDGILAFDAFDDYLLTLDYARDEMRIEPGELPRPDRQTVFNASGPDDRPWLRIEFSNRTRRMLIDSGAALSGFSVNHIDRFETTADPVASGASFRLNHIERRSSARLSENARFGPNELVTPTIQSTPGTELIGGEIMQHFIWTFDQRRERVRIERIDPDAPITFEPVVSHGMVFQPEPNGFRVADILPNTPASRVDIRAGDLITHFHGIPIGERGCNPPEANTLPLIIERDGAVIERVLEMFAIVD